MEQQKEVIITGYIRYIILVNIPQDIVKLLSVWICFMDWWDEEKTNKNIEITSNITIHTKHTIAIDSNEFYHAFGSNIISKGNTEIWTLKFTKYHQGTFIIGIVDDAFIDNEGIINNGWIDFTSNKCNGYGLLIQFKKLYNFGLSKTFDAFSWPKWNGYFEKDSIITMELDMIEGTLKYYRKIQENDYVNTSDIDNIAYDDIDISRKYRLCVALCHMDDEITIL